MTFQNFNIVRECSEEQYTVLSTLKIGTETIQKFPETLGRFIPRYQVKIEKLTNINNNWQRTVENDIS